MTIVQLMQRMQRLDVRLTVKAPGQLGIDAPRGIVDDEIRAELSARKPEILEYLTGTGEDRQDKESTSIIVTHRGYLVPDDLPELWREMYEERAAIREYDGGQAREHAEAEALTETIAAMRRAEELGDTQGCTEPEEE
jgi:TubC N-terminal docking domain